MSALNTRLRAMIARIPPERRVLTAVGAVLVVVLAGTAAVGATDAVLTGGTAPAASASPSSSSLTGAVPQGGGGAKNIVQVQNRTDGSLRVDGRVQLSVAPGPDIAPVNLASAFSSCTNCQTFAMALQVVQIGKGTHIATPQNAATAVNYLCNNCHTIAKAYQYVLTVDDPTQVSPDARMLVAAMKQQLATVHAEQGLTLAQVEAQFDAVIAQFQQLAADLATKRDESTDANTPGASPPPVAESPSPAASTTPQAGNPATPSPAEQPSGTPSAGPTPSASP